MARNSFSPGFWAAVKNLENDRTPSYGETIGRGLSEGITNAFAAGREKQKRLDRAMEQKFFSMYGALYQMRHDPGKVDSMALNPKEEQMYRLMLDKFKSNPKFQRMAKDTGLKVKDLELEDFTPEYRAQVQERQQRIMNLQRTMEGQANRQGTLAQKGLPTGMSAREQAVAEGRLNRTQGLAQEGIDPRLSPEQIARVRAGRQHAGQMESARLATQPGAQALRMKGAGQEAAVANERERRLNLAKYGTDDLGQIAQIQARNKALGQDAGTEVLREKELNRIAQDSPYIPPEKIDMNRYYTDPIYAIKVKQGMNTGVMSGRINAAQETMMREELNTRLREHLVNNRGMSSKAADAEIAKQSYLELTGHGKSLLDSVTKGQYGGEEAPERVIGEYSPKATALLESERRRNIKRFQSYKAAKKKHEDTPGYLKKSVGTGLDILTSATPPSEPTLTPLDTKEQQEAFLTRKLGSKRWREAQADDYNTPQKMRIIHEALDELIEEQGRKPEHDLLAGIISSLQRVALETPTSSNIPADASDADKKKIEEENNNSLRRKKLAENLLTKLTTLAQEDKEEDYFTIIPKEGVSRGTLASDLKFIIGAKRYDAVSTGSALYRSSAMDKMWEKYYAEQSGVE